MQPELPFATIRAALRTGQVGTPVAVRIVAHVTADHGKIEPLLGWALDAALEWLADEPVRCHVAGTATQGQTSVLVQTARGGSALVSAGVCGVGLPVLEIVVYGQRGITSWTADSSWATAEQDWPPTLSPRASQRLDLVRRSRAAQAPLLPGPPRAEAAPVAPPPTRPPWGVLLVSGHHTHQPNYVRDFQADPRCRLVAVTDEPNVGPERRALNERLARDLSLPYLDDVYAAVKRDDVRIVSICAEPERRGPIIVAAAEARKHLYLDKPLAGSLRDAEAIVRAVRGEPLLHHMFSLVPSDAARRTREWVESGRLGDPVAAHVDLTFAKGHVGTAKLGTPRREHERPERFELPDAKREMTNIGVYPLVLLHWLFGRPVRRVAAVTSNFYFREHQERDMEDFGQMLLELEGGLIATVTAGRTGWRSSPGIGLNRVCLAGTKQVALLDSQRPRAETWSDADPWLPPDRNPDDPLAMWFLPATSPFTAKPKRAWTLPPSPEGQDVKYFLDCLEQGRASEVSAPLAARTTAVLMAAYRSAATGEAVEVP